jgi:arylsulfatase A
VAERAKAGKPFFLYLPLSSPHTPIVPSKEWKGRSGLGDYGDFVMETDGAVGEVLSSLDKAGVADDTLVVFTSDNGCSPAAGTPALEKQGHFASAGFRGYKADVWDGGHRVPFLVRWPGVVRPDSRSDRIVCLTDLFATGADVVGAKVPAAAGEDSVSFLPELLGKRGAGRAAIVHHSIQGRFAIRDGKWKLCLCAGSGGWSPGGGTESPQLYDMDADPGETKNLAATRPEVVTRLTSLLESFVADGRSTPGEKQKNDVDVKIHKPAKK